MGLLSFLSRRSAPPAMSADEANALRARISTLAAVLDDVSAELVRMRRQEEAHTARFEQLTERVDFLARQVRCLAVARKDVAVVDLGAFFVSAERAEPRR